MGAHTLRRCELSSPPALFSLPESPCSAAAQTAPPHSSPRPPRTQSRLAVCAREWFWCLSVVVWVFRTASKGTWKHSTSCTYTHARTHMRAGKHTDIHAHTHTTNDTPIYHDAHTETHTHTHAHAHTHTHTYKHTLTNTHTHTAHVPVAQH